MIVCTLAQSGSKGLSAKASITSLEAGSALLEVEILGKTMDICLEHTGSQVRGHSNIVSAPQNILRTSSNIVHTPPIFYVIRLKAAGKFVLTIFYA